MNAKNLLLSILTILLTTTLTHATLIDAQNWLLNNQQPDGSFDAWSSAHTSFALIALNSSNAETNKTLAANYLQHELLNAVSYTWSEADNAALAIYALAYTNNSFANDVNLTSKFSNKLLTDLYDNSTGGFIGLWESPDYENWTQVSDSASTALSILALNAINALNESTAQNATNFLLSLQDPSGSFGLTQQTYSNTIFATAPSPQATTALVVLALKSANYSGPEVQNAINYLKNEANQCQSAIILDSYSLSLTILALAEYNETQAVSHAMAKLQEIQNQDGGFTSTYRGIYPQSNALDTATSTLALQLPINSINECVQVGIITVFPYGGVGANCIYVSNTSTIKDALNMGIYSIEWQENQTNSYISSIGGVGCANNNAFCNFEGNHACGLHWQFYTQTNGQWQTAQDTPNNYQAINGSIIANMWTTNENQLIPPNISFNQICNKTNINQLFIYDPEQRAPLTCKASFNGIQTIQPETVYAHQITPIYVQIQNEGYENTTYNVTMYNNLTLQNSTLINITGNYGVAFIEFNTIINYQQNDLQILFDDLNDENEQNNNVTITIYSNQTKDYVEPPFTNVNLSEFNTQITIYTNESLELIASQYLSPIFGVNPIQYTQTTINLTTNSTIQNATLQITPTQQEQNQYQNYTAAIYNSQNDADWTQLNTTKQNNTLSTFTTQLGLFKLGWNTTNNSNNNNGGNQNGIRVIVDMPTGAGSDIDTTVQGCTNAKQCFEIAGATLTGTTYNIPCPSGNPTTQLFVNTVNGYYANFSINETYWEFKYNNAYAANGLSCQSVTNGDTIKLQIHTTTPAQQNNNNNQNNNNDNQQSNSNSGGAAGNSATSNQPTISLTIDAGKVGILPNFDSYKQKRLVKLTEKATMIYKHADEQHSITLKQINGAKATLTLASKPFDATLQVGQEKTYDVTNDNKDDIKIKLIAINGKNATLEITPYTATTTTNTQTNQTTQNTLQNNKPNNQTNQTNTTENTNQPSTTTGLFTAITNNTIPITAAILLIIAGYAIYATKLKTTKPKLGA